MASIDTITNLIKAEIRHQYGTISKFSEASGIPYPTIMNALNKGIGTMGYDTVVKICGMLNIHQAFSSRLILFDDRFLDLYDKLKALDEKGIHTVSTVLNVEYARCSNEGDASVKGFNGVGLAVKETTNDEKRIRKLIRQVKKEKK